ncbi:MAG: OmpH family outer membrane protein [Bacteroidales bacterium]|nr:OmpH family outer membrane protein [Bacteroidales bacterium]
MKKLPLILGVVSFLAVVFLFVWEFAVPKDKAVESEIREAVDKLPGAKIAYVEIDSVLLNFDMYYDLREDLMAKQEESENELNNRGRQYESGARDYEEKVRKGLVTRATAQQMEQELLQQQQELRNLAGQLENQLMEEERVMNSQVLDYIYEYLEEISAGSDYDYILAKSFGNPVMYADKSLDITQEVLKGINFKYSQDKSEK